MKKISLRTSALAAVTAASLAACGGGGGGGTTSGGFFEGTDVPIGVSQTVNDVIAYAKRLIANTSETTEPEALGSASFATSETDEPSDL